MQIGGDFTFSSSYLHYGQVTPLRGHIKDLKSTHSQSLVPLPALLHIGFRFVPCSQRNNTTSLSEGNLLDLKKVPVVETES